MATLAEIRNKYPQYKDLGDNDLADRLYQRFYTDIPREQFDQQLGLTANAQPAQGGPMDPLAQGASFGFSDELAGAFGAGMQAIGVPGALGEMSPGDAYTAYRDRARGNLADYRETNPGTSIALEIAGAVPTAFAVPFGAAAKGVSVASRMGRGAASGALAGGLYGAGAADGDLKDRATGAALGGTMGGLVGGALPAIGSGIGGLVGGIGGRIATRGLKPAERKIARAFSDDHVTLGQAQQLGPAGMVADLGPNLRQQTAAIAATPGAGQKIVRDAIGARQAGATQRVTSSLDQNLGARSNIVQTADQIVTDRAKAAGPLYRAAYTAGDRPIISPELERLIGSPDVVEAMKAAARTGKSRAIADGMGGFNAAATVTDDGRVLFTGRQGGVPTYPNIQFWDYTYRALRDAASESRRAGQNDRADYLGKIAKTMRAELDQMVPEFGAARAAYSGPSGVFDALESGQSVFQRSLSPDMLRKELAELNAAELDAFRQGARAQVTQIMGTARNDAGAAWRELAEKGWNREKLELIFGRQQADNLIRTLQAEKTFSITSDKVTTNSETMARMLGAAEIAGATPTQRALNRAKDAYSFGGTMGPVRAAQAAGIQKLIGALSGGKSEAIIADMANGLVRSGADRDALIRTLIEAMSRKHVSELVASKTRRLVTSLMLGAGRGTVGPALNQQ